MDENFNEEKLLAADQNKYTNITELNMIISKRKERIDDLKDKAIEIKEELKREENDKVTTTRTLQQECDKKDKSIKDLEANIEKLEVHMTDNKEQRGMKYKEQIRQIEIDKQRELEQTIV
jgi:hypothetical protein